MSIYPVKISEWYVEGKPFGEEIEKLKEMLEFACFYCSVCKKPVSRENGYVMHSITFGGASETWCSEECLNND